MVAVASSNGVYGRKSYIVASVSVLIQLYLLSLFLRLKSSHSNFNLHLTLFFIRDEVIYANDLHLSHLMLHTLKAGSNRCAIDRARRNWCPSCRLSKCFAVQMNRYGKFVYSYLHKQTKVLKIK